VSITLRTRKRSQAIAFLAPTMALLVLTACVTGPQGALAPAAATAEMLVAQATRTALPPSPVPPTRSPTASTPTATPTEVVPSRTPRATDTLAPAATATATATRTPTPTEAPTSAPQPTPTATKTPTPVRKVLTYRVSVNCPRDNTIEVELNYEGVTTQQVALSFNRGGFHWNKPDQKKSLLMAIEASAPSGKKLPISEKKDPKTNNYAFLVSASGNKSIQVRYRVNVGFWDPSDSISVGGTKLGGYSGQNYCVIEPALLFLTPSDLAYVGTIRVFFSLPEGWETVTFWEEQDGSYKGTPHALRMSKGPFGFGHFAVARRPVGKTRVVVAAAEGVDQPEVQLERAMDLYEYYQTEVFGVRNEYIPTGSPRDGYIAIFIPARDAFYNFYHEEYGLYMSLSNQDWDNFAHMLSHNWTMDLERADAPWYVTEGFVEYLQVKITLAKGYISQTRYQEHLRRKYDWYATVAGTKKDLSLVEAPTDTHVQYDKGALVALLLDESLRSGTNGQVGLEDLMQLLYREASSTRLSTQRIKELTSKLAGRDFSSFFDNYVTGRTRLPLTIEGDQVVSRND
jgi:hypothetical protein